MERPSGVTRVVRTLLAVTGSITAQPYFRRYAQAPVLVVYRAGPDLKAIALVRILDQYSVPDKTIYAVFPERQYLPAKVRAFLQFVSKRCVTGTLFG